MNRQQHARIRCLALEDTYEMDVFSPIRHDWLEKTDSYLRSGSR